ncbi:MAG: serine peptidase, partial [Gammaproteobacteria bacterium]
YSSTGSFNGLAFAIPINTAMNIAEQLKNKGFVSRGWLGVSIQNVNQDLARSFALQKPRGALVSSVIEGSPAEKAGIKAGDIILTFNGKKVKKSTDLPPMVGTVAVGKSVEVELMRAGKRQTLAVTIGELDEGNQPIVGKIDNKSSNRGLSVANLSRQQKEALALDEGVIVHHVAPNSAAADAGFRQGDVIVNINNQAIADSKAFEAAMKNLDADTPAAILVIRKGRSLFIPL